MAPPISTFPVQDLPSQIQVTMKGKRRKGPPIDLKTCPLFEMLQYECDVQEPRTKDSRVLCWPVERLFRRYVFLLSLFFVLSWWLVREFCG